MMMMMMMRRRRRRRRIRAIRRVRGLLNAFRSLVGCLLEVVWRHLGASWGPLGGPGGLLEHLGCLGESLGASWGPLGGLLGASWGLLGGLSGPSWGILGASG